MITEGPTFIHVEFLAAEDKMEQALEIVRTQVKKLLHSILICIVQYSLSQVTIM